ncbi:hypothetical protein R1CP_37875 (plasmid) [Rhodococcus opacus]|uniref:Uncharacterized protein n=1 Tax=Rhodococcus opacus TaxID=37919 RepID=A0A1B1KHV2_RHOOP|nr:hypothetical protein R1CP_37875 [Rhodococcus opacus]
MRLELRRRAARGAIRRNAGNRHRVLCTELRPTAHHASSNAYPFAHAALEPADVHSSRANGRTRCATTTSRPEPHERPTPDQLRASVRPGKKAGCARNRMAHAPRHTLRTHCALTAGRNRYATAFDPTAPAHAHQAQRRDYQRSAAATRERHLAATCTILNPHTRNAPPASELECKLSRFVRNATATQRHAPRCPCPLAKSAI